MNLYIDDDSNTILSPMITLQKNIFEETNISAVYLVDIQSCASVDVVSTASPSRGYEEIRHGISLGASHRRRLTTIGLGYSHSTEHDYTSHGINASYSQELFQRNFTIALNLAHRWDEIGRVKDKHFSQDLEGLSTSLSLTQLLSRRMLFQFTYFFEYLNGYQASPYRMVPVYRMVPFVDFSVPETHPERRLRNSFTGRLKESLTDLWFAEQSFRFYFDSWGLTGETLLLQIYRELDSKFTFRLRYRLHLQEAADFYKEHYQNLREFISRDRELGTLRAHLAGPQVEYQWEGFWIFSEAAFDVKIEYFFIDYDDYALLESKEGLLIGFGLRLIQ